MTLTERIARALHDAYEAGIDDGFHYSNKENWESKIDWAEELMKEHEEEQFKFARVTVDANGTVIKSTIKMSAHDMIMEMKKDMENKAK